MAEDDLFKIISILSFDDKKIQFNSGLEDKILGVRPSSQNFQYTPSFPQFSSFETEYQRMRQVATEEDDFNRVIDIFRTVANRSFGLEIGKAKDVLREAFQLYTKTQQKLAQMFAEAGHFELVEDHLKNTRIECSIQISSFETIALTPVIQPEEVIEIIDVAVANTDPRYFLVKADKASERGDIFETEKYVPLSLRSLLAQGIIRVPRGEKLVDEEISDDTYSDFFRFTRLLQKIHRRAYGVAVRKKLEEAVGYALNNNKYDLSSDKSRIAQLGNEVRELLSQAGERTIHERGEREAFFGAVNFLDQQMISPWFETVTTLREDLEHPQRLWYKSTREKSPWGKITGYEKVPITSALVPTQFYEEVFGATGLPIPVHPFFAPAVELYLFGDQ